ncbi:MAG: hypothetical protein KBG29_13015 [Pseudomonadales bacterium]|nr:hypothetical protein [Pseudomonadales bacterium]
MRLSLLMRCPLHEVLAWPLWVVHAYADFLAREPATEDRLEVMLAQLAAQYGAVHRAQGAPVPRINDFLLYRDAWADADADDSDYSAVDREIMRQLHR